MGGEEFSNIDQLLALGEESYDRQKNRDDKNDSTLKGLVGDLLGTNLRLIVQAKNTDTWLSVQGTTVSGKVFSATTFCDFLCARYNVTTLNLHIYCDGCDNAFEVCHALSWIKGGLFIARQNEVSEKIFYLSWQAFISVSVSAEPLIYQGRTR